MGDGDHTFEGSGTLGPTAVPAGPDDPTLRGGGVPAASRGDLFVLGPLEAELHGPVAAAVDGLDRKDRGIVVFDAAGRPVRMNFLAREMIGVDWPVSGGKLPLGCELIDEHGMAVAPDAMPSAEVARTGRPVFGRRLGLRTPGGDVRWLDTWSMPVFGPDAHHPAAVVTSMVELATTALHPAGSALAAQLDESVSQAVVACDGDGRVTFANAAAERLYGFTARAALGRPLAEVVTWELPAEYIEAIATGGPTGEEWTGEVRVLRADRTLVPCLLTVSPFVVDGEPVATLTVAVDATERHIEHQALVHRSTHDDVTGLPNRHLFSERMRAVLDERTTEPVPVTVVLVDIDDFKLVNDGFGHPVGDQVLTSAARALRRSAHVGDLVARIAGASFAVCCTHVGADADPREYADRLRDAVSEPMDIGNAELTVRCSAGIASSIPGGDLAVADDLLQRADIALTQAKERGKGCSWVYDEALRRRLLQRFEIEAVIRRALASGTVPLEYQPIVALDGEAVLGAEALIRLVDEFGQPVPALEAIDVAESRGLIGPLGLLILETAAREAARWQQAMPERPLGVSVNVSARQLDDVDLPAKVAAVLDQVGLDPARLTLEMTESVLMADVERSTEQLAKLKMGGIRLSADDFGTGYSSLAYLKQFPLDSIKADLSFVAGLPDSPEDVAVVGAIMGVANALGLDVVAEGVEHARQVEALRSLGCGLAQGHLWSWSVPGEVFLDRVREIERRSSAALVESARGGAGRLHPEPPAGPFVETSIDTAFRSLAHELRAPLTVVLGYSSLLEEATGPEPVVAGRIRHAAERIERLVSDLDDAHALDGGRIELHTESVDVTGLTRRVAGDVTRRLGSEVWVEPLLIGAATVVGDPIRLEQIIDNLLTNAVKFSPAGANVLVLVGRRRRCVEVAIHDEGPGIAREQLAVVFRKYGRLDRSVPGSGIGLYLARGLARAHGGDLTYKHRRDRPGSVFTLRLPAAPVGPSGS